MPSRKGWGVFAGSGDGEWTGSESRWKAGGELSGAVWQVPSMAVIRLLEDGMAIGSPINPRHVRSLGVGTR